MSTKPPVITPEDSVESIVSRIVSRVQSLDSSYVPVESDDVHLIAQACADEIVRSAARKNLSASALLVQYSTGEDLDALAANVGLTRLAGTKPTASVTFTLSGIQANAITVYAGTVLSNTNGDIAVLLEDVSIGIGTLTGSGTIELDAYVSASEAVTQTIVTPLPYIASVTQTSIFGSGAPIESDESLRERYLNAWESVSTAGSRAGYIYWTRQADARIWDADARSSAPMQVEAVYYSPFADSTMQERVLSMLSMDTVRPLTDQLFVRQAVSVLYDVTATLYIEEGSGGPIVLNAAQSALIEGMQKLQKMGRDIPLSKIISLLHVDKVLEVALVEPLASMTIAWDEVGVLNIVNLTIEEYVDA